MFGRRATRTAGFPPEVPKPDEGAALVWHIGNGSAEEFRFVGSLDTWKYADALADYQRDGKHLVWSVA